ncbi:MAG: PucR family transcriptional regulator [Marmoricola sp.]
MSVDAAERSRLETVIIARLPDLLEEVRDRLADRWPEYADFLATDEQGVVEAARLFVHRLVEITDDPPQRAYDDSPQPGDETAHLVFEQIGRQQLLDGVELTRLLTAFQLGARIAWRHVSSAAVEIGFPAPTVASLGDAVFVFVNQLSFAATRGYLAAQLEDQRAREHHRDQLVDLLLSGRASPEAVAAAAARAGWALPTLAAVVLVDPADEAASRVVDGLGADCLPVHREGLRGAIVPDPVGRRRQLTAQLRGTGAVVGYGVPLDALPRSCDVARIAAVLCQQGLLHGDPVFAAEHLDTIIVGRDRSLLEALRRQVLTPLEELSEGARERLAETLASWLLHQGNNAAIAEDLRVHPQTVRYRMAQLRALFGDDLEDPRTRARLFLALAWR